MEREMTTEDDLDRTVPLSEFQEGQWWLLELQKHWGEGESSDQTRRAAKVALNFAYSYFRQREAALKEHEGGEKRRDERKAIRRYLDHYRQLHCHLRQH